MTFRRYPMPLSSQKGDSWDTLRSVDTLRHNMAAKEQRLITSSEFKKMQKQVWLLVYEMPFIRDINPSLNKQSDSIRAKLFTWHFPILIRTFSFLLSYLGYSAHWTYNYFFLF